MQMETTPIVGPEVDADCKFAARKRAREEEEKERVPSCSIVILIIIIVVVPLRKFCVARRELVTFRTWRAVAESIF